MAFAGSVVFKLPGFGLPIVLLVSDCRMVTRSPPIRKRCPSFGTGRYLTLMLRKNPTDFDGVLPSDSIFVTYAPLLPFPAHTVSMTVLGFMGSRVMRTPMALLMALAMAAGGGTMFTSPTPRTPNG